MMLILSVIILLILAALYRGLHTAFYIAHIIVMVLISINYHHYYALPYTAIGTSFIWPFFVAHILSISLFTFAAYGYDKQAARHGKWRISERSLKHMTWVGGTIGAFFGQRFFRHKLRKRKFIRIYIATLLAQLLLGYLFWLHYTGRITVFSF
ncbi:MAG: DUF1294 domain-containing protein [Alphaproteobacteria bacterium]|nr:DUF1294 domain-containing protein [Alphaproteobacteria bacterium]